MENLKRTLRAVLGAAALFATATAMAAPADDMKALLESGKATEAYELGKKYPDLFGEPAFDFYFGIAAIDADHPGEGALAIERYLLNFPDNPSARLQLARGYFGMGDDARAREEFEALQKTNPPAETAAGIQRYLDAIRLRESAYTVTSGGYVEIGAGYDSNVNAAPATASVSLPVFGPTTLAPNSRKLADSFGTLGAGGFISYPVMPGISLFATGQVEQRYNQKQSAHQFDLGNFGGLAGVSFLADDDMYRVGLNYSQLIVGSTTFRRSTGVVGEWQHQIDKVQSFSLGLQVARFTYGTTTSDDGAGTLSVTNNGNRNSQFSGVTAGYRRALAMDWQPVLTLGLNTGQQDSLASRNDLMPRTRGANIGVGLTPAEKWGLQLGYAFLESKYRAPDFFAFPDARRDKYNGYTVGVTYLVARDISIRGEALTSKNKSNADAYAFPRDTYTIKLRYEFK